MISKRLDRLSTAISQSGLTKGEIAERAGMHRQVLTDMLSGKIPGSKHIAALANVLQVTVEWLETGDGPPKWGQKMSGTFLAPTDKAEFFVEICREITFRWKNIKEKNSNEYQLLYNMLPEKSRVAISAKKKPISAFQLDLDELLQLGQPFNLPIEKDRIAFKIGFAYYVRTLRKLHLQHYFASTADAPSPLPMKVFAVCRAALLSMKAQRQAMQQSWGDVRDALAYLWSQRLGAEKVSNMEADEQEDDDDLQRAMEVDLELISPPGDSIKTRSHNTDRS